MKSHHFESKTDNIDNLFLHNNTYNYSRNSPANPFPINSVHLPDSEHVEETKLPIDHNADENSINLFINNSNTLPHSNENQIENHHQNEGQLDSITIYNWYVLKYLIQLRIISDNGIDFCSNKLKSRYVYIYNIILYSLTSALIAYIFLTEINILRIIFGIPQLCVILGLIFTEIAILYLQCKHLNQPTCFEQTRGLFLVLFHLMFFATIITMSLYNVIKKIFLLVLFCIYWIIAVLHFLAFILLALYLIILIPIEFVIRLISCKLVMPYYTIVPDSTLNYGGTIPDSTKQFEFNSTIFKINKCIICLELFHNKSTIYVLKCHETHIFHVNCLKEWVKRKYECPSCRRFIQFQT